MAEKEKGWEVKATCPRQNVILFTRQLSILLHNGVPLVHSLDVLAHQAEYPNFGVVISAIAKKVEGGHQFSSQLSRFPKLFPDIYVSMVEIGEATGALTDSLSHLADWLEHDDAVYRRVKSALFYPTFVLAVSLFLTLILFYTVIPKFVSIFEGMKIELPALTKLMIFLTDMLRNPGVWTLAIAGGIFALSSLKTAWETETGACRLFSLLLMVPVLNRLLVSASVSRYTAAAGISLSTGVDVARTLFLASRSCSNPLLRYDSSRLVRSIQDGAAVADAMAERPDLYPPTMVSMIRAGEESGHLEEMFSRAREFYSSELDFFVDSLSALIEPILLMGVAIAVALVLVSIFMPLYSYVGNL